MVNTPRLSLPEPQAADSMHISTPAFATIWTNVDGATGPTFCTSGTKPASPYRCQWIYLTDSNSEQVWDPVSSAWVTIKNNPTGIISLTNTPTNVALTAAGTEYQVVALNNITIEPFRNYKIHVEGIIGFSYNPAGVLTQPTQSGAAFLRYANASTVTIGGTQFSSISADASQSGTGNIAGIIAQQNLAFDGIYTGTSATQLSVGWSYKLTGTLTAHNSSQYAQNTLMYVERI